MKRELLERLSKVLPGDEWLELQEPILLNEWWSLAGYLLEGMQARYREVAETIKMPPTKTDPIYIEWEYLLFGLAGTIADASPESIVTAYCKWRENYPADAKETA